MNDRQSFDNVAIFSIERPAPVLMTYYVLVSLLLGPLFFVPLVPLFFRYHTLRYRFDAQGISMRWGILFRREINLTYARIQDIHLRSNVVERWLRLARIEVQTASGSSGAEMVLEGLLEFEAIRDFLYTRMRGSDARRGAPRADIPSRAGSGADAAAMGEVAAALRAVTAELRAVREMLAERQRSGDDA